MKGRRPMTRAQLLKELGLSSRELHDLMKSFGEFLAKLKPNQRAVVERSLPTLAEASALSRAEVKPDELQQLFEEDQPQGAIIMFHFLGQRKAIKVPATKAKAVKAPATKRKTVKRSAR
jgi:hypothetical protein